MSDLWEKQNQLPTGNVSFIKEPVKGIGSPISEENFSRNSPPPLPIKPLRVILETILWED